MIRERFREVHSILCQPGSDMMVSMMPPDRFKCTRIIIGGQTASFEVWGITVGIIDQLDLRDGTGEIKPVPALVFSPVALDCNLKLDTCDHGLSITIKLKNISKEPASIYIRFVERITVE